MYVGWMSSNVWVFYACGCPGRWARGMFSAVIICIMDFVL